MAPSAFEIPEIVALIAQFLTQGEMAKCMATCRLFYSQFEPLRWQRLHISMVCEDDAYGDEQDQLFEALWERPSDPEAAAILRNRHHMRSIDIRIFSNAFLKNLVAEELPQSSPGSPPSGSSISKDAALESPYTLRLPGPQTPPPVLEPTVASRLVSRSPPAPLPVVGLRKLHIDISQLAEQSRWRPRDVIPPTDRVLRLLGTNSLIADLLLPTSVLMYRWVVDTLIDIFEHQLPCLERLTFGKNQLLSIPFDHCPPLLHALTKHGVLRELHCLFTTTYSVEEHGDYFSRNSPDLLTMPSRSLRALTLPRSNLHFPETMVLRVLTNCVPHLQDLEVPDFSMQEGSIQNTRTLDALALQRLRFEQAPRAVDVPVAIMAVNACKALTSFRAKFLHYADNLVMALDATHAGTLEEFTLYRSGFFSSHLIHHLLCRCPRLKEFSIANDMWDCGLRLRDVMDDKVWACKGLKTLRLIVCRSIRDIDDGQDEDMPMEDDFTVDNTAAEEAHLATADTMETDDMGGGSHCAKPHRSASDLCAEGVRRLYQRIGELSELEILELRYTCLDDRDPLEEEIERDMTLEGGLPFLSELKSLRQLLLISDLWSEMGQCEVEFIESNWPRLELVAFGLDAKEMDWEGPEFGHWRWLKKMRPEVRFIFLDDDNQEVYSQF